MARHGWRLDVNSLPTVALTQFRCSSSLDFEQAGSETGALLPEPDACCWHASAVRLSACEVRLSLLSSHTVVKTPRPKLPWHGKNCATQVATGSAVVRLRSCISRAFAPTENGNGLRKQPVSVSPNSTPFRKDTCREQAIKVYHIS